MATPLDAVPLWAVFFGTAAVILVAVEIGYRLGKWRSHRANREKEAPVGSMVAAVLGLLAFLLAFTFGIAGSRLEARREALLNEVNAIGTAYLRTDLLPEPQRSRLRELFRQYVAVRLEATQMHEFLAAKGQSEQLHGQMWTEAVAAAAADSRSVPVGLFIQSLNEVIDLHLMRVTAGVRSRIPTTIWAVLYGVSVLGFAAMGFQTGLSDSGRTPATIAVAVTFAAVIWLVVDLDRPQAGLIRLSQQPMMELQESMK